MGYLCAWGMAGSIGVALERRGGSYWGSLGTDVGVDGIGVRREGEG